MKKLIIFLMFLAFQCSAEVVIKTDNDIIQHDDCRVYWVALGVDLEDVIGDYSVAVGCEDAPQIAPAIRIDGITIPVLVNTRKLFCPIEFFLHAPDYEEAPLSLYIDCRKDLIFKEGFD